MDYVYQTILSKPKADVVLLKMNSGDSWFTDASVNGTKFKFLMDTGASKSVMSMKSFKSIPELFRPQLHNPGQIVATAIQVDSVEMLPDSEPDDDKSITSPEPVLHRVRRSNGSRRK